MLAEPRCQRKEKRIFVTKKAEDVLALRTAVKANHFKNIGAWLTHIMVLEIGNPT